MELSDNGVRTHRIRVMLYDECAMYRLGVRTVLEGTADMAVVGEVDAVADAVECVRRMAPTVAVIGTAHHAGVDGVVRAIRDRSPVPIPALVLAAGVDSDAVLLALAAGARGYLHRDTLPAGLVAAVRSVAEGGLVLAASAADPVVERLAAARIGYRPAGGEVKDQASLAELTPRQHEVLRLVAEGLPNAEIAHRMRVSVATVKSHLSGMLHKLHARDRTQLAVIAHQNGLAG